jgi:peptidoglycan/LPS O-acetylase OafA/YrhL
MNDKIYQIYNYITTLNFFICFLINEYICINIFLICLYICITSLFILNTFVISALIYFIINFYCFFTKISYIKIFWDFSKRKKIKKKWKFYLLNIVSLVFVIINNYFFHYSFITVYVFNLLFLIILDIENKYYPNYFDEEPIVDIEVDHL